MTAPANQSAIASSTPRTDEMEMSEGSGRMTVPSAFARQLERELAEETRNKKEFERDWLEACDQLALRSSVAPSAQDADQLAAEVEAEADRLEREGVYSAQGITRDWLRSVGLGIRRLALRPSTAPSATRRCEKCGGCETPGLPASCDCKEPRWARPTIEASIVDLAIRLRELSQDERLNKFERDYFGKASERLCAPSSTETAPMLPELCKALGWQGGTRHQALSKVARLVRSQHDGNVWAEKLKAVTAWLDEHQPDVWRRGLWDAVNEAQQRATPTEALVNSAPAPSSTETASGASLEKPAQVKRGFTSDTRIGPKASQSIPSEEITDEQIEALRQMYPQDHIATDSVMDELRFQDQTRFYDKERGFRGNCLQACLASIFGLPMESVPDFTTSPADWQHDLRAFVNFGGYDWYFDSEDQVPPGTFYIVNGPSKRGVRHSTVWKDGKMVHDPHPDKSGLVAHDSNVWWFVRRVVDKSSTCTTPSATGDKTT